MMPREREMILRRDVKSELALSSDAMRELELALRSDGERELTLSRESGLSKAIRELTTRCQN